AVCLIFLFAGIASAQCINQIRISDADLQVLDEKARAGDMAAAYSLGEAYLFRMGSEQDRSLGISWLRQAADKGMSAAEYKLSLAYRLGCGVPKDETAAYAHLLKAAEAGYAPAQYDLGARQYSQQHYVEAGALYLKAALQGVPEAQIELGKLYEN